MRLGIALGTALLGVGLMLHGAAGVSAAVDELVPISTGRPCAVLDGDSKGNPDRYSPLPAMSTPCAFTDGDQEHIAGVTIGGSVTIDLGELYSVATVVLHGCQLCFVQTAETDADNASFTRFGRRGQVDHSDPSYPQDPYPARVVPVAATRARYVRVTDLGEGPKIREIEVFGNKASAVATTIQPSVRTISAPNPLTPASRAFRFAPVGLVVLVSAAALGLAFVGLTKVSGTTRRD